jgi:hypothetical protein
MYFEILSTCKSGGYLYCRTEPPHPKENSNGLYPLHRVIVENYICRLLHPSEDVHHINENKLDNRIENLEVLSKSDHAKKHIKKVDCINLVCPNCTNRFAVQPHVYRLRKKRNKSGVVFCSRSCGGVV